MYTVDWNDTFNPSLVADIGSLTADDIVKLFDGPPDVIWASPDCTTYSVAAISHHRRNVNGKLVPISDYAIKCDTTNTHVVNLIEKLKPKYWFIENPRGAMRKMDFVEGMARYTVTYCQYGDTRMKPTDIWTNHPNPRFKPPCRNGAPCHIPAPRGSKTGTQGLKGSANRSIIPEELCDHIAMICTDDSNEELRDSVVKNVPTFDEAYSGQMMLF